MQLGRKSSVGGDALYLTASRIAVSLISLVTSMLLARFRSLEEYGTYSQIIMVTDLVSTLLLLGLPNSINYFLAKAESDNERQRFMSAYVTLSTVMTVLTGICLFASIPLIIDYFNNPAITVFEYVFFIYPWSSLMINSLSNTCVVYGKANRLIVFNVVQAISTLSILLLSKVLGASFRQYMVLYMGSLIIFAVYALGWMGRLIGKIRLFLSREIVKEIFVFSIPMGLASVVGTLNAELDKLVIGKFFTTEEYAVFANAAKELPVTILATSLTAVLLPRMVRLLREGKARQAVTMWGYASNISFCFMSLIVGGFVVFAPDIMSLFYSEKYVTAGGVAVFRVYAVILLFRAIYWGIILNATGKTKFVFYSSLLTLVCNLIGNIIACYTLGFIGPAISSLVVTLLMAMAQLTFASKIIKVSVKEMIPWKQIAVYIIETCILGCVFAFIRYGFLGYFTRYASIAVSITLGCIWTVVYGALNKNNVIGYWKRLNAGEER